MATWPSGKARVCKTLIPSSILGVASKGSGFVLILFSYLYMYKKEFYKQFISAESISMN